MTVVKKNLSYGSPGDTLRKLDLYLPEAGGRGRLLVYLHGGAWITGSKDDYALLGDSLAALGIAVAVVDYRLSTDDNVRHPDHSLDCAAAILWLWENSDRFQWNPASVFVAGHSAGAHAAAIIASERGPQLVSGFIGIAGIYDLPSLVEGFPDYINRFVRRAFGPSEHDWVDASPQNREFSCKAPWLLIHSRDDELVDPLQTERFHAHLQSEDIESRMILLEQGRHYDAARSLGQAGLVTDAVLAFLGTSDDR